MKEYYYDTPDYATLVADVESKYSLENISEEDYIAYLVATDLEGWWDGNVASESTDWVEYCAGYGVDASAVTDPAEMLQILAKIEYDNFYDSYDPLTYYRKQMVKGTLEDGIDVTTISGIEKVDELTCTVLFDSVNISGDKLVAWQAVVPQHYYGADWSPETSKGDLAGIKSFNGAPLGCGPYKFVSYENNIVTLVANENYFKGCPKIPNLKFQVVNEEDKVDLVIAGDVDITDPSASLEIIAQLDAEGVIDHSSPYKGTAERSSATKKPHKNGEIRQNYYFFADLKENAVLKTDCDEGKLEWVDYNDVLKKDMPFTAKGMLEHYMSTGRFDDKIYGGVTTSNGVVFTEMDEF